MRYLFLFTLLLAGCAGSTAPPTPIKLHVVTTEVAVAQPNKPYHDQLQAVGGTQPYHWRVTSGQLPSGVVLADNGALSGTPTTTGKFDFTVEVRDSSSNQTN